MVTAAVILLGHFSQYQIFIGTTGNLSITCPSPGEKSREDEGGLSCSHQDCRCSCMGTPDLHVQHSHALTDLITLFLHRYRVSFVVDAQAKQADTPASYCHPLTAGVRRGTNFPNVRRNKTIRPIQEDGVGMQV